MAPDVFANNFRFTAKIENAGSMNSTGARELALEFSQERRQGKQSFDVDPHIFFRNDRREILSDRSNAFFATDAAAARDGSEPFCRAELHLHAFGQLNRDDVFAITRRGRTRELVDLATGRVRPTGGLVARSQDPFRNEKAGGEFFIVAGRAHGGGKSFARDADLERFFDGEIVMMILK